MEENKPKNTNVETYAEQMAEVIRGSDGSLIKKIIKQEEESEIVKMESSPEALKNKLYLYAGLVLALGALAIFAYFIASREKVGSVDVVPEFTPIIFLDETHFLEIEIPEKDSVSKDIVLKFKSADVKDGGVLGLYLTEEQKILSLASFLGILEASLSRDILPLFSENFLIGSVNNETKDPFVLLNTKSFSEVFNEMRAWEEKMFFDLYKVFDITLDDTNKILVTKDFEDGIIENKNARVLYDDMGGIALMYVFIDDNFIVIAKSEQAVGEVISRLAGSI